MKKIQKEFLISALISQIYSGENPAELESNSIMLELLINKVSPSEYIKTLKDNPKTEAEVLEIFEKGYEQLLIVSYQIPNMLKAFRDESEVDTGRAASLKKEIINVQFHQSLRARIIKSCLEYQIETLEDLTSKSRGDLACTPGFGAKLLDEIEATLYKFGLSLRKE
ncbi:MAG: DNA-directed RNA polymerase subunit alpha C-terminal domain-containing protein [Candidatus Falkowbacteria bacterium]